MDFRWMALLFTISALLHAYFWKRFFGDTGLSRRSRAWSGLSSAAVTILIPFSFVLRRHLSQPLDSVLYLLLISWLAGIFFLVCLRFLAGAIPFSLYSLHFLKTRKSYDPSRRIFISRALALGTLSIGGGGLVHGIRESYADPRIREIEVKLDRLPRQSQGLTIAHVTDLHVAPWTDDDFVERLVEQTNALRPDIIVVTGDVVDGSVAELLPKVSTLSRLSAKHGVYFVTGNHEYYVGVDPWLSVFKKMGMKPLMNQGGVVAESIYLVGIPDAAAARWGSSAIQPNISTALAGRPEHLPSILLAHQPRAVHAAAAHQVDLQLSGHTHGGQVWPFGMMVMALQPYLSGLHRHNATQIYVNSGAGSWGPPIRIGAPSEIAKIVLI